VPSQLKTTGNSSSKLLLSNLSSKKGEDEDETSSNNEDTVPSNTHDALDIAGGESAQTDGFSPFRYEAIYQLTIVGIGKGINPIP